MSPTATWQLTRPCSLVNRAFLHCAWGVAWSLGVVGVIEWVLWTISTPKFCVRKDRELWESRVWGCWPNPNWSSANTNDRFGHGWAWLWDSVLMNSRNPFLLGDSRNHSSRIWILFEFCQNGLINLAGPSAKFDSSRIPGIARILPDSGRNQWRTIKTLISSLLSPSSINTGGHYFCEHRNILTCETG